MQVGSRSPALVLLTWCVQGLGTLCSSTYAQEHKIFSVIIVQFSVFDSEHNYQLNLMRSQREKKTLKRWYESRTAGLGNFKHPAVCVSLPAASPTVPDQFIFCASTGDVPLPAETFHDPQPHMLVWKQALKNMEDFAA